MAEGIVAWLNSRWEYGVIAVSGGFVTFPQWELMGVVRVAQWVTFDDTGRGDAQRVVPGRLGEPAEIHGCPRCGGTPVDEDVRVHRKRFSRDAEVYVTFFCSRCTWREPERLATMVDNA